MKRTQVFILTSLALCILPHCQADPSSPGLRPPPDECAWTVTYAIIPGAPVGHIPKTEEVREKGSLATASRVYVDNTQEKVWIAEGIAFISINSQRPHAVDVQSLAFDAAGDPFISSLLFRRRYTGLAWIKPDDKPTEIAGRQGQSIYYYRGTGTTTATPLGADDLPDYRKASAAAQEAWVDVKTGLPIAFIQGGAMGVYRHEAAPSAALSLPPDFAKALRYYNGYKD
ncbi:MAG: hypothetical protein ACFUZC_04300 [Chthoniobacteraceae bacterium]